MARIAVAATAPFGADVLEGLAGRHEVACAADAPRPRRAAAAASSARRPRRSARSGSGSRSASRSGCRPRLRSPADTVVVAAYGLLIPPGCSTARSGSTSTRRCCRAGAARRRSSARSWPATRRPASRSTARRQELDAGPIAAQEAFPIGPEDDAGAVYARSAALAVDLLDRVLRTAPDVPRRSPRTASRTPRRSARRPRARPLATAAGAREPGPGAVAAHRRAGGARRPRRDRLARARRGRRGSCPVEVQPEGRRRMTLRGVPAGPAR